MSSTSMQEAITLIQLNKGFTLIGCTYIEDSVQAGAVPNNKEYHFKCAPHIDPKKDDILVVQSRSGFALVKVSTAKVLPTALHCGFHELKHVVCKVNTKEFDDMLQSESEAVMALSMSDVNSKLSVFQQQVGESAFLAVGNLLAPPVVNDSDDVIE